MNTYGTVVAGVTELVVSVVLFIGAGAWLDKHFGWGVVATMVGAAVGSVLGFIFLIKRLSSLQSK